MYIPRQIHLNVWGKTSHKVPFGGCKKTAKDNSTGKKTKIGSLLQEIQEMGVTC